MYYSNVKRKEVSVFLLAGCSPTELLDERFITFGLLDQLQD
jgi:hypothetical protein